MANCWRIAFFAFLDLLNHIIMRRRRELDLKEDIKTEVKSVVGSLLFWLVKKLIDRLLQMLKEKGWVQLEDDTNGI